MSGLKEQQALFTSCNGHALVLGGPGSGKTTSALIKIGQEVSGGGLAPEQRVLFLSFARATIARLCEHAKSLLEEDALARIQVETYHGFWWRLLKSHLYLLNGHRTVRLLTPPDAAAMFSGMSKVEVVREKERLYREEGRVDFDQFAPLACQLLRSSAALRQLLTKAYPVLVLDEFQDTDISEWNAVRMLGESCRLIALADPEQRIYEFRGADPERIQQYVTTFKPTVIDYGTANFRSNGTDIANYGNDLLSGAHRRSEYKDVAVVGYQLLKGSAVHLTLKTHVMDARKRLIRARPKEPWSAAVLVPTKRLMIDVSDYLGGIQQFAKGKSLPAIEHDVAVDADGPTLAAGVIATLLEPMEDVEAGVSNLLGRTLYHIRGRRGAQGPTQAQQALCSALESFLVTGRIRGPKRQLLVVELRKVVELVLSMLLSGDPGRDWLAVRKLLNECESEQLKCVAEDAKYLRLLHKGGQLSTRLSELWRTTGTYAGAVQVVEAALVQEHFSAATRRWDGITVMTIHKSKGKEFDEVILYEGAFQGRYIRDDCTDKEEAQALLALRVGVTRARQRATILTPSSRPSRLLV